MGSKILVTGAAGFIGAALTRRLLDEGHTVVGIDNINSYYSPALKLARLKNLGIEPPVTDGAPLSSDPEAEQSDSGFPWLTPVSTGRFTFIRMNLEDTDAVNSLFNIGTGSSSREGWAEATGPFHTVIHLAAQAGVRYSLQNPRSYISSNIVGFLNILEAIRHSTPPGVVPLPSHKGEGPGVGLIFASSSSVYGLNSKVPFSETDRTDSPVSLYAATKKSNEMMAHAYSALYGIPVTGLRFFTVYGPWGRPDMSPWLFIDAILNNRPIKIFNGGDMLRDFTYIDDVVESIVRLLPSSSKASPSAVTRQETGDRYRILNIGNQHPVRLMDYIATIERIIGREAIKEYLPMQPGDVYQTYADTTALTRAIGFTPSTPLADGLAATIRWFRTTEVCAIPSPPSHKG